MKWNHLPSNGGLYQQHPELLDKFYYIFAKRSEAEAAEQAKRDRERGGSKPSRGLQRKGRR